MPPSSSALSPYSLLFAVVGASAAKMDGLGIALANGIAIATMIAALGSASGAHFNPAVTLGLFLTGRISLRDKQCGLRGSPPGSGGFTLCRRTG